jgi:hypothetical protein
MRDACLGEQNVAELASCIRSHLDCADICDTTGRVLSRHIGADTNVTRTVLEACAAVCKSCGDECQHHGERGMARCEVCGNACRRCEQACRELISSLG